MVSTTGSGTQSRIPLSKDRVLEAAIEVADDGGLEALTMRGLAKHLDVEAMSLYYHVTNKEALLDGVAQRVAEEILAETEGLDPPATEADWMSAMRERILAARRVILRHKWAPEVFETRTTMNPAVLLHFHDLLAVMRAGGFSYDLAHHAMHAIGSRALGFSQELFVPNAGSGDEEMNDEVVAALAEKVPLLFEMLEAISHTDGADSTVGWCDDQTEFEFSLDLMLDGLDRMRLTR